jgi:hypothetical protein
LNTTNASHSPEIKTRICEQHHLRCKKNSSTHDNLQPISIQVLENRSETLRPFGPWENKAEKLQVELSIWRQFQVNQQDRGKTWQYQCLFVGIQQFLQFLLFFVFFKRIIRPINCKTI